MTLLEPTAPNDESPVVILARPEFLPAPVTKDKLPDPAAVTCNNPPSSIDAPPPLDRSISPPEPSLRLAAA